MKTNKFNVARKEAKKEFNSLNQCVKVVLSISLTDELQAWLKQVGLKASDVTVKNVVNNWHSIKIDGKLGYSYTRNGLKTEKVKEKFTTNDVFLSLSKMAKSK